MTRLVLRRKVDETVLIHEDGDVIARIKVGKIDRGEHYVSLLVEADPAIGIDREEIFRAKYPDSFATDP